MLHLVPPATPLGFEDLCCDLWRRVWRDPNAQKNGRTGQPQAGVDVFGRPDEGTHWAGLQCKWKDLLAGKKLGRREILAEVVKAESFRPPLGAFILATTARADVATQRVAREVSDERRARGQFPVSVASWDDILGYLAGAPDLIRKHYPELGDPAFLVRSRRRPNLWQTPPAEPEVFRLMHWRTRLARLYGRDREMAQLLEWAREGNAAARVRVVTGAGGAGKTRLAAEVCDALWNDGWETRFIELEGPLPDLVEGPAGLLWVVDYPEEKQRKLRQLLRSLRELLPPCPLRVLLLSRQPPGWWQEQAEFSTHASFLFDTFDLQITGLSADDTIAVVRDVCARMRELYRLPIADPVDAQIIAWRGQDIGLHPLPLFATAAAVHSALYPDHSLALSGRQVVRSLVSRERGRLDGMGNEIAESYGFDRSRVAPSWAARICGLAAVADELPPPLLERLANRRLRMSLPPPDKVVEMASQLPFWLRTEKHPDGFIGAVRPDIFAAALLLNILSEGGHLAPGWLWAAIAHRAANPRSGLLDLISRLVYDVGMISDDDAQQPLIRWLVTMVEEDLSRAKALAWMLEEERPPEPSLPLTLAMGARIAGNTDLPPAARAATLSHYATHLLRAERPGDALPWLREAVALYRSLPDAGSDTHRRGLARALDSLGMALADCGDPAAAVEATGEAVAILSQPPARASMVDRAAWLHDRAAALNGRGLALAAAGDRAGAEQAFREMVAVYAGAFGKPLPAAERRAYQDAMARGLHNLSNQLRETRPEESLAAIRQAVDIRRRLYDEARWRYAGYLALSLSVMVDRLREAGLVTEALAANAETISLRRTLLHANPAQFGPALAASLNTQFILLTAAGRASDALRERVGEGRLYRRLLASGAIPMDTQSLLRAGMALATSGYHAVEQDSDALAIEVCTEGIDLLESIRREKPDLWSAELRKVLAGAYINRGNALNTTVDGQLSIANYTAAIDLLDAGEPFPADDRGDFLVVLALSLTNRAIELVKNEEDLRALADWEAAKRAERSAHEALGARWPERRHWQLLRSARNLGSEAGSRGLTPLVEDVTGWMIELGSALRAKGEHRLAADILMSCGEALIRLGRIDKGLDSLREGVASAEEAVAGGTAPTEPIRRVELLNKLGYGLVLISESTGDTSVLPKAEESLRSALALLPAEGHKIMRYNVLDSLGTAVLLQVQHRPSLARVDEAIGLFEAALQFGVAAAPNPWDEDLKMSRDRLERATELRSRLVSLPSGPVERNRAPGG